VQPGLRKAALTALERIGGNSVYAVLKKHENDKDPWVRFRVRNYLKGTPLTRRCTVQDPPTVPVEGN